MNKFELLGRINWLDIKYNESGSCFTKIILAKKKPKSDVKKQYRTDDYESFPIVFFNTRNGNTAERLAENCKVGDYIKVNGMLTINKYSPKDSDTVHTKIELLGWGFKQVMWNSEENKYIDIA